MTRSSGEWRRSSPTTSRSSSTRPARPAFPRVRCARTEGSTRWGMPSSRRIRTLEVDPIRYVSYLPLCHVAEQMFTNFMGLRAASETLLLCGPREDQGPPGGRAPSSLLRGAPRVGEVRGCALAQTFCRPRGSKRSSRAGRGASSSERKRMRWRPARRSIRSSAGSRTSW